MTTIVWFRYDLRLADNPALYQAIQESDTIIPVFIWSHGEEGRWSPGTAQKWWLHQSLESLGGSLQQQKSRLIIRKGPALPELREMVQHVNADCVYWNRRYVPALRSRDRKVARALQADGVKIGSFRSRLLHDPADVQTTSGGPYHVYTPFWKKFVATVDIPPALPAPRIGPSMSPESWPESLDLGDLQLLPDKTNEADGSTDRAAFWSPDGPGKAPGEQGAHRRLSLFLSEKIADYETDRDRPDLDGTSLLSPRLHHGELSPRQIWHAVQEWIDGPAQRDQAESFLQELVWREFSYHLLYHYPETATDPLRDKFRAFDWEMNEEQLRSWQRGETGYPIVDAAMRQLRALGWMHNRLRMVVASFLTKDLLIPWQKGAAWFWDTLVDADLANNTMGWQWSAGCGADAQPYFRIFNPVSQGNRHDPNGAFVRQWIPELETLPDKFIHSPWEAPAPVLAEAGVKLNETYPAPIVDHSVARSEAMRRYNAIK